MSRTEIAPKGQQPGSRGEEMEQFNTRLPGYICDSLRATAQAQNRPIRDLVEACLVAGLQTYIGPVPPHLTVVGPCVGHGTGGFVWCARCDEDSREPAESCYLVVETCTRPGCGVRNAWPVCPACLAALADEIAYLCVNCLYTLEEYRRQVERREANSDEVGKRIDAFLKPLPEPPIPRPPRPHPELSHPDWGVYERDGDL